MKGRLEKNMGIDDAIRRAFGRTAFLWAIGILFALCSVFVCANWPTLLLMFADGERIVLKWRDANSGKVFSLIEDGDFIDFKTYIAVDEGKGEYRIMLDDDPSFWGHVAFVRRGDWLLVVQEKIVLAAYRYSDGVIYRKDDQDALPMRVWDESGSIVASIKIGPGTSQPTSH